MGKDELLLPGITFVMFLVIYRSFNGSVVGSRKEIIAPESNIVTHFSNLLVEITLPFDCVRWMVVVMVAGIKNQLNVRARSDKRHLRVSFAAARLEPQLTFVLGTVTKSCVSHFTITVQSFEQVVTFELLLLIWDNARHLENVPRLWWLVKLHRIEWNHASQSRVVHHVHVHHFQALINYFSRSSNDAFRL
jgi:hypothetical protein